MSLNSNSKDLSRARFNKFAQSYVTGEALAKGEELTRLVDMVLPQAHWIVLDVACGGGHTVLRFAPHVARVIATDISIEAVKLAKENAIMNGVASRMDFVVGDGLSFLDAQGKGEARFDAIDSFQ